MNYKNIDYRKYLSIDNGKGIILSKENVEILKRNGFDFNMYTSIKELLTELDNYSNENYIEEELEEVINELSETYYYNYINK